jgi:hypothetical protein
MIRGYRRDMVIFDKKFSLCNKTNLICIVLLAQCGKIEFYDFQVLYQYSMVFDFSRLNSSHRGPHFLQGYLRGAGDETSTPGPLYHLRG